MYLLFSILSYYWSSIPKSSHLLQPGCLTNYFQGKDAIKFVEKLVVGDVAEMADGTGSLTLLTTDKGTVLDDSVLAKVSSEEVYMVLNAGCRDKDSAHIKKHLEAF